MHVPSGIYLFGDIAIFINVIEVKGPVELLSDRASEQHRQADDKVLKADRAISVYVKRVEQEVSISGRICVTRRTKVVRFIDLMYFVNHPEKEKIET